MIETVNPEQLAYLARSGAGLTLSARGFTPDQLAYIARSMQPGSRFIIKDIEGFTTEQLAYIARSGPGAVHFGE